MIEIAKTIAEIRKCVAQAHAAGKTVGFVPTMGALHAGHASLIETAARRCDYVVVSVFVNPTQFGPGEDFEKYPRPFEKDAQLCERSGAQAIFVPSDDEMYPRKNLTWVTVDKLTEPLCGQSRPGHFRGVTTVCTKLFNIVGADLAFFGQKDAQQATVIRRMAADLNMPLEIVVCPTVREPDGLAMSSRNQYLSPQERSQAPVIFRALQRCAELIGAGEQDAARITEEMDKVLKQAAALRVEYLRIVDAESLDPCNPVRGRVLVAIAARLGSTRLIDNIVVDTIAK
jgi:pantoate--beta-alanine ligase